MRSIEVCLSDSIYLECYLYWNIVSQIDQLWNNKCSYDCYLYHIDDKARTTQVSEEENNHSDPDMAIQYMYNMIIIVSLLQFQYETRSFYIVFLLIPIWFALLDMPNILLRQEGVIGQLIE